MPNLPSPSKTEQIADKFSIAKLEILRSADGVAGSELTINAHLGKERAEKDPLTGYNLFDPFETRTLISISLPALQRKLAEGVAASLITKEQADEHIAALIAMDAEIVALAEQSIELYRQIGLVTFPEKVSRFV